VIKRLSLVWKRPDLSTADFAAAWLGDHADAARRLAGVREYTVDVITHPPAGVPDGIATLRFDSREACDAAFADPELGEFLRATRDEFAERVEVVFVDENLVVGPAEARP
jgi:uncharacterized protein (TIGR02118 family)